MRASRTISAAMKRLFLFMNFPQSAKPARSEEERTEPQPQTRVVACLAPDFAAGGCCYLPSDPQTQGNQAGTAKKARFVALTSGFGAIKFYI
jgi:hypothetical protein